VPIDMFVDEPASHNSTDEKSSMSIYQIMAAISFMATFDCKANNTKKVSPSIISL
jgi:hypothetical protein